MDYKETLFFIGKCLTISQDQEYLTEVSKKIKSNSVNWEAVVKVSTSHYVFPAIYCNLLRANLLSYLPSDLVSHMIYITDLNRERNRQIIQQAEQINQLLTEKNITPIFLKGTGNILGGLYVDVAERMVGDIDFIVGSKEYELAIKTLLDNGYYKVSGKPTLLGKHYPRLIKDGAIAAIEIHKDLVKTPYELEFNYEIIKHTILKEHSISLLSLSHQLCLSIIAKQINDDGQYYNTISLRNAYDVWILSKHTNPLNAIKKLEGIFHPLNNFLALCHDVISHKINYLDTPESKKYLAVFKKIVHDSAYSLQHHKKWSNKLKWKLRYQITKKALLKKDYRQWYWQRVTDRDWLKGKFRCNV